MAGTRKRVQRTISRAEANNQYLNSVFQEFIAEKKALGRVEETLKSYLCRFDNREISKFQWKSVCIQCFFKNRHIEVAGTQHERNLITQASNFITFIIYQEIDMTVSADECPLPVR